MLPIATDALTELYLILFVGVIPLTTLLLLSSRSIFNIAALYVDVIVENSASVITLSSMHDEINEDNFEDVFLSVAAAKTLLIDLRDAVEAACNGTTFGPSEPDDDLGDLCIDPDGPV